MKLKEELQKIADYIVNRVVNGEYEFIKRDNHNAYITIDNYEFELWISNGKKYLLFYTTGFEDTEKTISVPKMEFTTDQKNKAWIHIQNHLTKESNKKIIRENKREIKELQEQNEELK
jgi:hypothetical protein